MKPLFLLSLLLLSLAVFSAEIKGKVVAVSDGDTITVLDEMDKGNFKIRLDKIDAPEKKQPFGSKAKQFLSSLCSSGSTPGRFPAGGYPDTGGRCPCRPTRHKAAAIPWHPSAGR